MPAGPVSKESARVALINLDDVSIETLRTCLLRCGIDAVSVARDSAEFLRQEKFAACALKLNSEAVPMLEAARASALNRNMIVLGISSNPIAIVRFAKYGINAVLDYPLNPETVGEIVRFNEAVMKRQMRRYVRVPLMTLVQTKIRGQLHSATSRMISPAGMSLCMRSKPGLGERLVVSFVLPNTLAFNSEAEVCWLRDSENMVGVRFVGEKPHNEEVKIWIEEYLAIA